MFVGFIYQSNKMYVIRSSKYQIEKFQKTVSKFQIIGSIK